MIRKFLSLVLCLSFLFQQVGFAQAAGELNISGYFNQMSSSFMPDKFRPVHLRYFSYDIATNNFTLLLDKGDAKELKADQLQQSSKTLLKYFLTGVSLPNESFWVNLRPDREDQIIDDELAKTDVGKIMLEADLQLKKDTARFTSPQTPEGKEYWNKLYQKAGELFGSENITIPTITRPWIVPNEIIIREAQGSAYIYKATLKVMLEQDHIKDSPLYNFSDPRLKVLNEYSSELIRESIIPKLTKEINIAKRYAPLRQAFYSLVLSRWFKSRFTGKAGTYAARIDSKDLNDLTSQEQWSKTTYFQQYKKSFQDGEYNIKEPAYTPTGQVIRTYFSGGIDMNAAGSPLGTFFTNANPGFLGVLASKSGVQISGTANSPLSIKMDTPVEPVEPASESEAAAISAGSPLTNKHELAKGLEQAGITRSYFENIIRFKGTSLFDFDKTIDVGERHYWVSLKRTLLGNFEIVLKGFKEDLFKNGVHLAKYLTIKVTEDKVIVTGSLQLSGEEINKFAADIKESFSFMDVPLASTRELEESLTQAGLTYAYLEQIEKDKGELPDHVYGNVKLFDWAGYVMPYLVKGKAGWLRNSYILRIGSLSSEVGFIQDMLVFVEAFRITVNKNGLRVSGNVHPPDAKVFADDLMLLLDKSQASSAVNAVEIAVNAVEIVAADKLAWKEAASITGLLKPFAAYRLMKLDSYKVDFENQDDFQIYFEAAKILLGSIDNPAVIALLKRWIERNEGVKVLNILNRFHLDNNETREAKEKAYRGIGVALYERMLIEGINSGDNFTQFLVANDLHLSDAFKREIIESQNAAFIFHLIENKTGIPKDFQEKIVAQGDVRLMKQLAKFSRDSDILRTLAKSDNIEVLKSVAFNRETPEPELKALIGVAYKMRSADILDLIKRNPSVGYKTFQEWDKEFKDELAKKIAQENEALIQKQEARMKEKGQQPSGAKIFVTAKAGLSENHEFLMRLAKENDLAGLAAISEGSKKAALDVEGDTQDIESFVAKLKAQEGIVAVAAQPKDYARQHAGFKTILKDRRGYRVTEDDREMSSGYSDLLWIIPEALEFIYTLYGYSPASMDGAPGGMGFDLYDDQPGAMEDAGTGMPDITDVAASSSIIAAPTLQRDLKAIATANRCNITTDLLPVMSALLENNIVTEGTYPHVLTLLGEITTDRSTFLDRFTFLRTRMDSTRSRREALLALINAKVVHQDNLPKITALFEAIESESGMYSRMMYDYERSVDAEEPVKVNKPYITPYDSLIKLAQARLENDIDEAFVSPELLTLIARGAKKSTYVLYDLLLAVAKSDIAAEIKKEVLKDFHAALAQGHDPMSSLVSITKKMAARRTAAQYGITQSPQTSLDSFTHFWFKWVKFSGIYSKFENTYGFSREQLYALFSHLSNKPNQKAAAIKLLGLAGYAKSIGLIDKNVILNTKLVDTDVGDPESYFVYEPTYALDHRMIEAITYQFAAAKDWALMVDKAVQADQENKKAGMKIDARRQALLKFSRMLEEQKSAGLSLNEQGPSSPAEASSSIQDQAGLVPATGILKYGSAREFLRKISAFVATKADIFTQERDLMRLGIYNENRRSEAMTLNEIRDILENEIRKLISQGELILVDFDPQILREGDVVQDKFGFSVFKGKGDATFYLFDNFDSTYSGTRLREDGYSYYKIVRPIPAIVINAENSVDLQEQSPKASASPINPMIEYFKGMLTQRNAGIEGIEDINPAAIGHTKINDLDWNLFAMSNNRYLELFIRGNDIVAYGIVTWMAENTILRFQSFDKSAGKGDYWTSIYEERIRNLKAVLAGVGKDISVIGVPTDQVLSEDQLVKRVRAYFDQAIGWEEAAIAIINKVRRGQPLSDTEKLMIEFSSFSDYYSFGPAANLYVNKLKFALVPTMAAPGKQMFTTEERNLLTQLETGKILSDTEIVSLFAGRGLVSKISSSSLEETASSPALTNRQEAPGGIDFRAMDIKYEPMGTFKGLNFTLPILSSMELLQINIDDEITQIKTLVQQGIMPSGQRMKELVAACSQKGELSTRVNDLIVCLVDICRLEEENVAESSPELKETLVILDSDNFTASKI